MSKGPWLHYRQRCDDMQEVRPAEMKACECHCMCAGCDGTIVDEDGQLVLAVEALHVQADLAGSLSALHGLRALHGCHRRRLMKRPLLLPGRRHVSERNLSRRCALPPAAAAAAAAQRAALPCSRQQPLCCGPPVFTTASPRSAAAYIRHLSRCFQAGSPQALSGLHLLG